MLGSYDLVFLQIGQPDFRRRSLSASLAVARTVHTWLSASAMRRSGGATTARPPTTIARSPLPRIHQRDGAVVVERDLRRILARSGAITEKLTLPAGMIGA